MTLLSHSQRHFSGYLTTFSTKLKAFMPLFTLRLASSAGHSIILSIIVRIVSAISIIVC